VCLSVSLVADSTLSLSLSLSRGYFPLEYTHHTANISSIKLQERKKRIRNTTFPRLAFEPFPTDPARPSFVPHTLRAHHPSSMDALRTLFAGYADLQSEWEAVEIDGSGEVEFSFLLEELLSSEQYQSTQFISHLQAHTFDLRKLVSILAHSLSLGVSLLSSLSSPKNEKEKGDRDQRQAHKEEGKEDIPLLHHSLKVLARIGTFMFLFVSCVACFSLSL